MSQEITPYEAGIVRVEYEPPPHTLRERRGPVRKTQFMVENMSERHHKIAQMLVMGYKRPQIAEKLGITTVSVKQVTESPVVQERMRQLRGQDDEIVYDVMKEIREFAPKCVELLKDVVNDEEIPKIARANQAKYLLGLAGHVAPKNVNIKALHARVTQDDLEEIKARAAQAMGDSVID